MELKAQVLPLPQCFFGAPKAQTPELSWLRPSCRPGHVGRLGVKNLRLLQGMLKYVMYVCMYVCVHVCMCISIYIYIYMYLHVLF